MLMLTDPIRQWDRLFEQGTTLTAAMDAYRLGDVITVQFDLPGVDPSSIDLQIERGELRLSARRSAALPEGARYFVRERSEAVITRRVLLGDALDVEHVDAEYAGGVLTLRIPLSEHAKPRSVKVRTVDEVSNDRQVLSVESA
jgi:HSP20 family protein